MVSSLMMQRTKAQVVFNYNPQAASLDLVGKRSRLAVHILKACQGVAPLNQTELD